MSRKTTKNALLMSILSLALCCAMLIGTTFAWFTDSVTSANNVITAGNVDVTLEYWNGTEYTAVTEATKLFDDAALWEPGHAEVAYLKIGNAGSLALKYQLFVKVLGETVGKNKAGEDLKLSDYLVFSVVDKQITAAADLYTRAQAIAAAGNVMGLQEYSSDIKQLNATGDADYVALIIYMPATVGNEANCDGVNIPSIEIGTSLVATQASFEEDSFGAGYDVEASFPGTPVHNVDELKTKLEDARPGSVFDLDSEEAYELDAPLQMPAGVILRGVQQGVPAARWIGDTNADKTVIASTASGNAIEIKQTSAAEVISDVVLDGILMDCEASGGYGLYVKKTEGKALEGIQILNCAVVGAGNDALHVENACGAVIKGNYVVDAQDNAILVRGYKGVTQASEPVTAYIVDNVVDGVETINGAIQVENGGGDVIVRGNIIRNVTDSKPLEMNKDCKACAISVYDVYEGGTITIEENLIEGAEQGIGIYKYTALAESEKIIVRNNEIRGVTSVGIGVSTLHHKSKAMTNVEITDNAIISDSVEDALYIKAANSSWKIVASGNKLNGVITDAVNGVFEP